MTAQSTVNLPPRPTAELMLSLGVNPATRRPHSPAYLARTGQVRALHGPFRAPDVKTPDGWQVLTDGYDNASRVACHAPSRDRARKLARELNAAGASVTRDGAIVPALEVAA